MENLLKQFENLENWSAQLEKLEIFWAQLDKLELEILEKSPYRTLEHQAGSSPDFATRLTVKHSKIDKLAVSKILGVWIDESLSWERNTKEICMKAYSRISMLTKLKYAGVSIEDLLDIYILFIRSTTEYCSVAFHSSLTVDQTTDLERIQKTCRQLNENKKVGVEYLF